MKIVTAVLQLSAFLGVAFSFGTNCRNEGAFINGNLKGAIEVPPNFKVVFIGDQGLGSSPVAVLKQIKSWGAEIVIHSGDFDYDNNPTEWDEQINSVLGEDYPYFSAIGNHDLLRWSGREGYEQKLIDRFTRLNATEYCSGEIGVRMACNYKGFLFILSGVGTKGSDHPEYFDEIFSQSANIWKNVNWHKNQRLYQCGDKFNEVGYEVYEMAREYGAIISTAHEHSYCRSHLMSDFTNQVVASKDADIVLSPGKSFVFVSGLGGKSIRSYSGGREENEWWAATAASDDDVSDGALYCTFHIDNNPRKANCQFLDRLGKVWDNFDIYTELDGIVSRKEKLCSPKFEEYQILNSFDDVVETLSGERETKSKIISLGQSNVAALRFRQINLNNPKDLAEVRLQILGAKDAAEEAPLMIRGVKKQIPGSLKNLQRFELTESFVEWSEEDDDWEAGSVWVSPNINQIVEEITSQSSWQSGDDIVLILSTKGQRSFYSSEQSKCLAPSLSFEYVNLCK